jgi:hypothetical protein
MGIASRTQQFRESHLVHKLWALVVGNGDTTWYERGSQQMTVRPSILPCCLGKMVGKSQAVDMVLWKDTIHGLQGWTVICCNPLSYGCTEAKSGGARRVAPPRGASLAVADLLSRKYDVPTRSGLSPECLCMLWCHKVLPQMGMLQRV